MIRPTPILVARKELTFCPAIPLNFRMPENLRALKCVS
jgi:hypothetical protein